MRTRLRSWIVLGGSLVVGGTFILAGLLKSLDVEGFARDIALHGILGPGPSAILARILVPFEIVAGTAAIIGYRRRLALSLLIAALAVFLGATAYAWTTGNTEGCGCFGRYASRTPLAVIVEDSLLIAAGAVALILARPSADAVARRSARERFAGQESAVDRLAGSDAGASELDPQRADLLQRLQARLPANGETEVVRVQPDARRREARRPSWRFVLLACLAVASTVFTLASPSLPIDSFATALRPGVSLSDLGLDQIAGNLAEGDRLLVILAIDQTRSREAIPALNALAETPGVPQVSGLTSATEDERAEFFWKYGPGFDILDVPSADLRRLFRRAPRTFRVHNGEVLQVWEGVPPVEDFPT